MTLPQVLALSSATVVALIYLWPLIKHLRVGEMLKHMAAIAAIAAVAVTFYPKGEETTRPEVSLPPVAVALKGASKEDKAKVKALYETLADVVERDEKVIATLGAFRKVHADSLDLAFQKTPLKGRYEGLDVAIEEQLAKAVGRENVSLAGEKKVALVKALREVASDAAR